HPSIGFDRPEMPKLFRYGIDETVPLLRKHAPDVLGDPLHFAMRRRGDQREYQCIDPIGVSLGVGQSERAAPRQAQNAPPIDAAELTDSLDVGNQMRCRIGSNAACGFPALRSPVCFTSRVMGLIVLGRLSAWATEPCSR